MNVDLGKVDKLIDKYRDEEAAYIPLLQDINSEFRYLPRDALKRVSHKMEVPLSHLFRLATFYKSFSLVPRGEHEIQVCMGTACHVRGAPRILNKITQQFQIYPGETTADQKFTVETVNCVGACALGPLVVFDGKYFGHLNLSRTDKLLEGYHEENKKSS